jgi:DNA modification methylase
MPTLNWIGKEAVVNHHKEVPFRLLKCNEKLSVGEDTGNLLIQGDNLEALKALLPYYAGQVKCIYIDPPYNTGKEGWVYNDNVNTPEIKEWLGKVVGAEADDLSRHDKWLSMIYPRLVLAKDFLSKDGVIFVSIDDNEIHSLRTLMDELFGKQNLLSCFIWQTEGNFDNQAKVKIAHEYILAYTKDYSLFPPPPVIDPNIPEGSKLFKEEIRNTIVKNGPKNPVSAVLLPKGFPSDMEKGVIKKRTNAWPHYKEDVLIENSSLQKPVYAESGWSSKRILENFINSGFKPVLDTKGQETIFVITRTGAIEAVKPRKENQSHVISVLRNVGSTQQMTTALSEIDISFDYPKPLGLIKYLLSMVEGNDFIVLDFFAGSGTTGHAVLEQNKIDNGERRFILVEIDKNIVQSITAERLKKVVLGYKQIKGLGSGFRFCELGATLFDGDGQIREEVKYNDLAQHVYFIETGRPIPPPFPKGKGAVGPLLGVDNGTAIYLLYNGILKDKSVNGGNVLTNDVLQSLPQHKGAKIVYGNGCRIGANRLREMNITFKQIPYEIREM